MRTIAPFQGEFGLKILHHVPQVATLCQNEPCIVEIEEGEEALYPLAAEHVVVERTADDKRYRRPPDLGVPETRFVPEPYARYGITPDVVICPRFRSYGAEKNWDGWGRLRRVLHLSRHEVFAAGAPDSSYELPCDAAWKYPRFLDASIEAIRNARLVIATDAGLAHLAVLCGAPLLLVTYRGLVAPGPVVASNGKRARDEYWPAGQSPNGGPCRFESANHTGAPIVKVDGWESVGAVVSAATDMLRAAP